MDLLSDQLRGAICNKHHQGYQEQDQAQVPQETCGQNRPSMSLVELRAGSHLGLVLGFRPLQAVPPGAPAIQVGTNFRSTDRAHGEILYHFWVLLKPKGQAEKEYQMSEETTL